MPRLASDRRPLYLGWLLGVQSREVSGDAVEPEVPSGLGELDEAFSALVEFLEIDMDRVAAAAKNSRPADPAALGRDAARWISSLRPDERDDLLVRLISGDGHLVLELRQRVAQAAERASLPFGRRRLAFVLGAATGEFAYSILIAPQSLRRLDH